MAAVLRAGDVAGVGDLALWRKYVHLGVLFGAFFGVFAFVVDGLYSLIILEIDVERRLVRLHDAAGRRRTVLHHLALRAADLHVPGTRIAMGLIVIAFAAEALGAPGGIFNFILQFFLIALYSVKKKCHSPCVGSLILIILKL